MERWSKGNAKEREKDFQHKQFVYVLSKQQLTRVDMPKTFATMKQHLVGLEHNGRAERTKNTHFGNLFIRVMLFVNHFSSSQKALEDDGTQQVALFVHQLFNKCNGDGNAANKSIWHFDLCTSEVDTWFHSNISFRTRIRWAARDRFSVPLQLWSFSDVKTVRCLLVCRSLAPPKKRYLFWCFFRLSLTLSQCACVWLLGQAAHKFTLWQISPHSSRNLIALNQLNSFC